MNDSVKRKLAREVIILFGLIGITLITALIIWCYSVIIDKRISNKENKMKILNAKSIVLSRNYDDKFFRIKSILTDIYSNNAKSHSSFRELNDEQLNEIRLIKEFHHQLKSGIIDQKEFNKKEQKRQNELRKRTFERQIQLGGIPDYEDSVFYNECLNRLTRLRVSTKNNTEPDSVALVVISIPEISDDSILSIWNCLTVHKEHLAAMLPWSILNKYRIKTRKDLYELISQVHISDQELTQKAEANEIQEQVNTLKLEKFALAKKVLTNKVIQRNVKLIFFILLVIVYPLRLAYYTLVWAIQTYRKTI